MDPQDPQNTNPSFATGNAAAPSSFASSGAEKSAKTWKAVGICALVAVVGLGIGLAFALINGNEESSEIDQLKVELDVKTVELNQYKELTNTESPTQIETVFVGQEIDLDGIYQALNDNIGNNDGIFSTNLHNGKIRLNSDQTYQVADFGISEYSPVNNEDGVYQWESSFQVYLYRAVPNGTWKFSNFSGQAVPLCSEVTEEDQAALVGIMECDAD